MIKTLEKSGRNEDAAIEAALTELGLDRDDVSVEILERSKSGFLGIGAVQAKVRVSYEVPDEPAKTEKPSYPKKTASEKKRGSKKPAEAVREASEKAPAKSENPKAKTASDETAEYAAIRQFLEGLLEKMGVEAEIEIGRRENGGINVNLSGNSMGAIIGRRGETLDAIQHLTNYVINKGNDKRMHINIDAEEYRAKREDSLTRLAEKMAEKALKYKRSMALEPMNSYERHVIHSALQNYEGVVTASTGEEPNRRVVVTPVKTEDASGPSKPKTREWA